MSDGLGVIEIPTIIPMRGERKNKNNNVTNQEVDRKKERSCYFPTGNVCNHYFVYVQVYHNPQLNATKCTFARSLIFYQNFESQLQHGTRSREQRRYYSLLFRCHRFRGVPENIQFVSSTEQHFMR
jgi:hypothetical protein